MSDSAKIQMLDYEKPALEVGQYQVKIEQSITVSGINDSFADKTINFIVAGDRFTLSRKYASFLSGSPSPLIYLGCEYPLPLQSCRFRMKPADQTNICWDWWDNE